MLLFVLASELFVLQLYVWYVQYLQLIYVSHSLNVALLFGSIWSIFLNLF